MPATSLKTAARRLALAATIGAGVVVAAPSAASAAGTNACDASALQLSLLGGAALDPIHANPSYTPCVTADGTLIEIPELLGLVSVDAVTATTRNTANVNAVSESTVVGAEVGAVGPVIDSLTGPLLSGPDSIVGQVDGAVAGLLGPLDGLLGPLGGLLGLNLGSGGVLSSITGTLPAALSAALPDVLSAGVISAQAQATCSTTGTAQLSGQSRIADLRVLGIAVDANDAANRLLSLDTASLNLGQLLSVQQLLQGVQVQIDNSLVGGLLQLAYGTSTLSLWDLLNPSAGIVGAVDGALNLLVPGLSISNLSNTLLGTNGLIQPLLNQVQIDLPPGLLRAQVTPNAQSIVGDQLTQQALSLSVSALGQPILAGTLAQARVGAGAPGCVPPVTPPKPEEPKSPVKNPEKYSSPEAEAILQCAKGAPATLIDVYGDRGRTYIHGVAERRFVGATATIYLQHGRKKVGSAKIDEKGLFTTRVALPPAKIRRTNKARYYAVVGGKKTRALKFTRRMVTTTLTAQDGTVTLAGRVLPPLGKLQRPVQIKERVNCKTYRTVTTVKVDKKGRFRVKIKAAKDAGAVVYRAQTTVQKVLTSPKRYPTYTLPRVVGLS